MFLQIVFPQMLFNFFSVAQTASDLDYFLNVNLIFYNRIHNSFILSDILNFF